MDSIHHHKLGLIRGLFFCLKFAFYAHIYCVTRNLWLSSTRRHMTQLTDKDEQNTTWKRIPLLSGGDRFVTEGVRFQLWRVQAYCSAGRRKDPEIDWATEAGCQYQNRAAGSKQISDLVSQHSFPISPLLLRRFIGTGRVTTWRRSF